MTNLIIRTHISLHNFSRAVAAGLAGAVERIGREDGQDLVEYGGLLILIAAIIGALFAAGILSDFNSVVKPDVSKIFHTTAG